MRWTAVLLLLLLNGMGMAQESRFHADLRREGERVSNACGTFNFKSILMCGYTLFTDHPFHIAAGNLSPQNGFGLGGALVWDKNTANWRMSWNTDAVGTFSGAWRAGAYMQMIHNPHKQTGPVRVVIPSPGTSTEKATPKKPERFTHLYSVISLYAQTTSLNKIYFFGLGNNSSPAGASIFGMRETVVGANAIKPIVEWKPIRALNLALLGEINGRFVDIQRDPGLSSPSIDTLYTNASAPGLASQPAFVQLGQGVRIKPVIHDYLALNYMGSLREFLAPADSHYSFLRWTADLNHIFYLYTQSKQVRTSVDGVGPDSCGMPGDPCPSLPVTRNLNGTIGFRLLLSESITSGTSVVPFYFQPTLGGSDIDNNLMLGSFHDYRFRGPNLLLLQENVEHSIWGPFGLKFLADQGRVALTRGDLGFNHLKHSFAAGLTLRAGAFPMVYIMYAWGGGEGHHTIASMNASLLGASPRPSLD